MALERRNPLPPGRYWIHLDRDDAPSFDAWRLSHKQEATIATSHDRESGWTWYLFVTSAPLPWDAAAWGYPTVAGEDVRSETDVVQRPDPEPDFAERLERAADKAGRGLLIGVGAIVVAALVLNRITK